MGKYQPLLFSPERRLCAAGALRRSEPANLNAVKRNFPNFRIWLVRGAQLRGKTPWRDVLSDRPNAVKT
jgi:hypothetical protein